MFTGLGKATPKISPHSTGAKYHNMHCKLLRIRFLILQHLDDSRMNHANVPKRYKIE
jgi:hypothetical protein